MTSQQQFCQLSRSNFPDLTFQRCKDLMLPWDQWEVQNLNTFKSQAGLGSELSSTETITLLTKEVNLNHMSCWTLSEQSAAFICWVCGIKQVCKPPPNSSLLRMVFWLKGGDIISLSACQMQLYYASPTCLFTMEKVPPGVRKWANFRETQERKEE